MWRQKPLAVPHCALSHLSRDGDERTVVEGVLSQAPYPVQKPRRIAIASRADTSSQAYSAQFSPAAPQPTVKPAIGLRSGAPVIATAPIAIVPAHTEPPPSLGRQTPTCACQPRTISLHNRPYARDAILATTLARSATIYA